jgi:hypothetical protein
VGTDRIAIRRALVSVYDKTGLDELARGLHAAGVQIVSTGNSARAISAAGVPVTPIEDVTGFPEMLDGRVKTLHPHVHAGLLADRRKPEHVQALADRGIEPFDLVISNLYPFAETVARQVGEDETVEQIDIGGPSMVRAAAKNHPSVAVVVDPNSYGAVLEAVQAARWRRRHLRTPPPMTWRSPRGLPARMISRRSSDWRSSAPRCCGMARTRIRLRRSTSITTPRPGWPRRSSCMARRCRTTITSTPMPPGAPHSISASRASRW